MNEKALDVIYKLAISDGYRKSKQDFIKLMSTDYEALNTMYELSKTDGYAKGIEDFSILIGNKKLPEKKNPSVNVTESPFEDGSSESAETDDENLIDKLSSLQSGFEGDTDGLTTEQKESVLQPPNMGIEPARSDNTKPPVTPPLDIVETEDGSIISGEDYRKKQKEIEKEANRVYQLEQKEKLALDEAASKSAHNDLLFNNLEFQTDIVTIDDALTAQKEDEVVDFLTDKFSKYGFVFEPTGWGNKVVARTLDGLNEITLGVNTDKPEVSNRLRDFITQYSTDPSERDIQIDDFVTKSLNAQKSRPIARQNGDGSVSTHLMSYAEEDGRWVAFPTLFPDNPEIQSAWPDRWTEYGDNEWQQALVLAKERGEVYYFDNEKEAENFALGSWKHVSSPEVFSQNFYNENGRDFFAEQEMFDNYVDARDDIAFLETLNSETQLNSLTEEQQELYKDYFYKGKLDPDIEKQLESMREQRDELEDIVNDTESMDLRDELDLKLQKATNIKAKEAAEINDRALSFKDELEVVALQNFSVPLEDLQYVIPKNQQEERLLQELSIQAQISNYTQEFAAYKYEIAKTFFSRKNDEHIMAEYVTGMKAFRESIRNGWYMGKAGNVLIQIELGLKDASDKEVQEKLAEYLSKRRPEQSKFLYRFMRAQGGAFSGEAKRHVWGESGINVPMALVNGITLMAESLSQMLPYGMWIIPTTTALGTGIGAGVGATGLVTGPGGVVTTGAGALTGARYGFHTGMGLSGFVLEYTNSLMDAMRTEGYDLTNPDDVALAFADKEVWAAGRKKGMARGIPIGIVDAISSGLAGRLFKTGSVMAKGRKAAVLVGERMVFDPLAEGLGEFSAQVVAGENIDGKEIFLEMWGGIGNNSSGMAVNLMVDQVNFSNTKLANSLVDFKFMAHEVSSDERISEWATNMVSLGKISEEQNQEIQKNIGFKREATDLAGKKASPFVIARLMELLSAKSDMGRTSNLKQINNNIITKVNNEISKIVSTGKLVDAAKAVDVGGAIDIRSKSSKQSSYTIDGKQYSKESFVKKLNKLSDKQLTDSKIIVSNDSEVQTLLKDKSDAVQKSKTESVDVGEQTTDGSTVGEGDTETTEETGTEVEKEAPDEKDAQEYKEMKVEEDRRRWGGAKRPPGEVEDAIEIPNAIKATKADKIKYNNGTLDDARKDGIIAEIADKNRKGKKLTPFQEQVATENQDRVAEIESDMQGAIDLEQSLKEDKGPKVDFKTEDDYRGTHTAARPEEGYNNRADNPSDVYPADIYGPNGKRYYGDRRKDDGKVIDIIKDMKGNPEKEITIYRAVPKGTTQINTGDWVTLSRDYAVDHGKHATDPSKDMDVISQKVKVKDLYTAGESIHEWGYNPSETKTKKGKKDTKVDFKSQPESKVPRLKQKDTKKGIVQTFKDLLTQRKTGVTPESGMFFTSNLTNNTPLFNLDEALVEKIKNGEVEVSYEVLDTANMTDAEARAARITKGDSRIFLHADGQIIGRMDIRTGMEADVERNGTVMAVEIHPQLRGLGLGQQLYESANTWVQENYQQPLKSDELVTSDSAEKAWAALEDKGLATRKKQKTPKKKGALSQMTPVMQETQFSFKDEKMLLDEMNRVYQAYNHLLPSDIFKIFAGSFDNNTKLLAFMQQAFPSVNISSTQEAFNNVISRDGVKKHIVGGEVIYGVTVDGDIWINPEVHNTESKLFDTSIHEFGHIWTNYLQTTEKGRAIWRQGADLVQQTALYKRQLKKFDGDVFKATNETMAILIANKGGDIASASLISKFNNWLSGMWAYIKSKFKMSKDLTTDEIQDLTLDKFLGTALADIFAGKEIKLTDKQLTQLKNPEVMFSSTDSMVDIVNKGRQQGISDASIKSVLQGRGFKVNDINEAMRVEIQDGVTLPAEFTNIEGGALEGFRLFNKIRKALNEFAYTSEKGKRKGTRVKTYAEVRAEAQTLLKDSPLYQKQNQDTQMAMQVALDRSLDIRTNPNTQKEISTIRNTIKDKKLAVKNIKALQNQLRGLIRNILPKSSTYSHAKINSLLKRITDLTPENYIAKTEEVLNIVDKQKGQIKNELIKKIEKLVKKKAAAKITRGGRRVTKGLDAIGQDFFRAVKDVLKIALIKDIDERNYKIEQLKKEISPENILEQLDITETELINKALANPESLSPAEQRMLHKLQAYDTVGELMTATMEEVEAKLKVLEEARSESIGRLQVKRLERAMKAEKLGKEATKQIAEIYPELFTTDEKGNIVPKNENQLIQDQNAIQRMFRESKLIKGVKALLKGLKLDRVVGIRTFFKEKLLHLGSLTALLDRSGKGKNFFTNNIYKPLRKMARNQLGGVHKLNARLDDMANSIPGITKGYKQIRQKLYIGIPTLIIKGQKQDFNGDQLLRIYTLSKNEVQRKKLERQGFTPEIIEDIKKLVGPQAIEFADKTVEFLSSEYFESINDTYKQANDTSLGYVENYFPTQTITKKETAQNLIEEGNFGTIFTDDTHSALKERTDKGGDVKLGPDFTSTLANHIESMEHYKSYAVGVKDLTAIINTPAVKVLLDSSGLGFGIKRAINFAINPESANRVKQGAFEKLQSKFTSWALAFKLMQIPKQASSFINAFEDYHNLTSPETGKETGWTRAKNYALKPAEFVLFMADFAYVMATFRSSVKKAYQMSPVFKDRIDKGLEGDLHGLVSGNPTVKDLKKDESTWGERARKMRFLMSSPTVIGDVMGIMGYMANYNRNIKEGMSHNEAVEVFEQYETTQQTRGGTEKIPLQMSNDMLNRAFTMFGSTLFLQINKVYISFTEIMRAAAEDGKIPSVKTMTALTLNLGMANVLFVGMANSFKYMKGDQEDKEEVLKKMRRAMLGLNLLSQIPLAGSALEQVILRALGENPRQQDIVNPFSRVFTDMYKFADDDKLTGWQKTKQMALTAFELWAGFQTDWFMSPMEDLIKGREMDETTFYDVIGVSKSYRPDASKNKDSKKSKGRKSKGGRRGGKKN